MWQENSVWVRRYLQSYSCSYLASHHQTPTYLHSLAYLDCELVYLTQIGPSIFGPYLDGEL